MSMHQYFLCFVTMLSCVFFANLCWKLFCLFVFALNVFTLLFLINLFLFLCQKSKTHIKSRKSKKSLIDIIVFCHKHILPCTFVLMVLFIYEPNLFLMHSYHCGRNLDFYVIVVNRSSILSWMISQWFCWYWDMHRLMSIYFSTLLFYCFCLKSSTNVNLQMKKDNELQKSLHILVFD